VHTRSYSKSPPGFGPWGGGSDYKYGYGILYKINLSGDYKIIYTFNQTLQFESMGPFFPNKENKLYGVALYDDQNYASGIFIFDLKKEHMSLVPIPQAIDGVANFIVLPDESLLVLGVSDNSLVFVLIAPNGTSVVLYNYYEYYSSSILSTLVPLKNQIAYGVTSGNGQFDEGLIYSVNINGSFNPIHSFSGYDGSSPTDLVMGQDGNLYGTSIEGGGGYGTGSIFTVHLPDETFKEVMPGKPGYVQIVSSDTPPYLYLFGWQTISKFNPITSKLSIVYQDEYGPIFDGMSTVNNGTALLYIEGHPDQNIPNVLYSIKV